MASAVDDLVYEVTTSTGTGNLTTSGVSGKQRGATVFGTSDLGANNPIMFISHQSADEWEIAPCYYSSAGVLVRGTPIKSSNGGAAVNFSAGTKDITNAIPAAKIVTTDATQTLTNKTLGSGTALGTPNSGNLANCSGLPFPSGLSGLTGPTYQIFTSSGVWTKPAGCVKIKAYLVGGGGGGGGIQLAAGQFCGAGGGGAGGLGIVYLDVTSTSSINVTVGAGGAAGDGANVGGPGGTGGFSNLNGGALGAALGGNGGNGRSSAQGSSSLNQAGNGGTATGCTINAAGAPGSFGMAFATTNGQIAGAGGSSMFGGGGPGVRPSGSSVGNTGIDGSGFGAGGGGAATTNTASPFLGGAGSPGVVIIEEYYA